ncbi:hypothetical protein ES703_124277 [subsurface metagenome]
MPDRIIWNEHGQYDTNMNTGMAGILGLGLVSGILTGILTGISTGMTGISTRMTGISTRMTGIWTGMIGILTPHTKNHKLRLGHHTQAKARTPHFTYHRVLLLVEVV